MIRYAFLVGCDEYSNFANIAFCEADVALIQETLVEYCDYEYEHIERIFQYRDCDDTPQIIYDKLQKMVEGAKKGDSILFYFAGHGVKEDDKGYLLLADSKSSDYQGTALDLAKINKLLRESNIDSFMILDACHSGMLARSALASSLSDIISDTGCITLASCSANEESHPYVEKEQGVFTYYLCEEIKKTSLDTPVYIEKLKMEVCNSVTEWAQNNYKNQTPTLNGLIIGNKAFAFRNNKKYQGVENRVLLGKNKIQENASRMLNNFAVAIDGEMEKIANGQYYEKTSDVVLKDEAQLLYTSVLKKWLEENSELKIEKIMLGNSDWRVFGRYYIYMANNKNGEQCIVMLNILQKYNYTNVYHAINNLKEIRDYYSKFGKKYEYYQIILISKYRENDLNKMMKSHKKLQKIYSNKEIKNTIVYLNNGKFEYISSNYQKN